VTSQTTHINYKWPSYATEWNPPWKYSAYATYFNCVFVFALATLNSYIYQRWPWTRRFCVFLSHPELKICEKPESLFNFGSCRSLRGHFLSKAGVWTGVGCSKLKKLPDPD